MKEKEVIAIIGLGLIGASLALNLKKNNRGSNQIIGIDINPQVVENARAMGAVDKGYYYSDLKAGLSRADIVFLAIPINEIIKLAPTLGGILPSGAVVTDTASTKAKIVAMMEQELPPAIAFVGGHPMTGSEHQGIQAADPFLFENAAYVLTPTPRTSAAALEKVAGIVKILGAEKIYLDPGIHDETVAAVSHLPHLMSASLLNTVKSAANIRDLAVSLAAGSFRDATRVANSSPEMWRDICLDNKLAVLKYLKLFREEISEAERMIENSFKSELLAFFAGARGLREKMPPRGKGYLSALYEIIILVEDTPGMIEKVAGLLGREGINIAEIEILRVRETEEGTIRLAFKTAAEREKAMKIMNKNQIKAWNKG